MTTDLAPSNFPKQSSVIIGKNSSGGSRYEMVVNSDGTINVVAKPNFVTAQVVVEIPDILAGAVEGEIDLGINYGKVTRVVVEHTSGIGVNEWTFNLNDKSGQGTGVHQNTLICETNETENLSYVPITPITFMNRDNIQTTKLYALISSTDGAGDPDSFTIIIEGAESV